MDCFKKEKQPKDGSSVLFLETWSCVAQLEKSSLHGEGLQTQTGAGRERMRRWPGNAPAVASRADTAAKCEQQAGAAVELGTAF